MKILTLFILLSSVVFSANSYAQTAEVITDTKDAVALGIKPLDEKLFEIFKSKTGVEYSQSDAEGLYVFSDSVSGKVLSLSTEQFVDYMNRLQSNRTISDKQGAHGWLVEYSSSEGRVYLWYPNNRRIVNGFWKVMTVPVSIEAKKFQSVHICFQYTNGHNYVDNIPAKQWDCWPASRQVVYTIEKAEFGRQHRLGDVFGLKSGNIPYVLKKDTRPAWPDEVK